MADKGPDYIIYTDGGCAVNPGGTGACAAVITDTATGEVTELAKGYRSTTNNRMEISAVIMALEHIPTHASAELHSDSQYVLNTMAGSWQKKTNLDLWDRLDTASEGKDISLLWVRGHNGEPLNERCDELCTIYMHEEDLTADTGYEEQNNNIWNDLDRFSGNSNTALHDSQDGSSRSAGQQKNKKKTGAMGKDITISKSLAECRADSSQFEINDYCRKAIQKLYMSPERKFKSYSLLKTYGRDGLSSKTPEDLINAVDHGKEIWNVISQYFTGSSAAACFRWYARGLSLYDAIRKEFVDQEITENYVISQNQRNI